MDSPGPKPWAWLATNRARQGDLDAATQDAQAALAVDADHRDGLLLLAEIRRVQKAPAETAELLARAVRAHPEDAQLRLSLAAIHQEQGDTTQAREQLETLIELEPGQMLHVARLVVFLSTQDDKQGAEQLLRETVERNPDDPQAKLLLVEWTTQERGVEEGARLLEQFIVAEPDAYRFRFPWASCVAAPVRATPRRISIGRSSDATESAPRV